MRVYAARKHQRFRSDQMSKSAPTLYSGWRNGDMTWADSPWMIKRIECQAVAFCCFDRNILMPSEHWVATVDSRCCHSISCWAEQGSTLDKSCCPLLMCSVDRIRPLLSSCYQMVQLHTLLGMIYLSPVSLTGWKHHDMFIERETLQEPFTRLYTFTEMAK